MNPTAILTADLHIREDVPICRTDDFWQTQANKIKWLARVQRKYNVPIIDSGDLFHKWKSSNYLARWMILNFPKEFITLNGNHDTPYHSLEQHEKSILGVVEAAEALQVLSDQAYGWGGEEGEVLLHPFPWSSKLTAMDPKFKRDGVRNIAICHCMTYKGRNPWPGCKDPGASTLLQQMEGFDLVLTGHNHKTFTAEHEGRILVNPGSLTRQTTDQADHKPCIFLWYAEDNHVEQIFVPIEENVISREHLEKVEERDGRIDAFVSRLSGDFEISLSFRNNLEQFFATNRVRGRVKDLVFGALPN